MRSLKPVLLSEKATALLAGIGAFGLYVATLCPELAWGGGDSAKFAIWVKNFFLGYDPCDHPLYIVAAKLFSFLPLHASLAYKLNLFSAACGALTVLLAYLLACSLTLSATAALCGAVALAFSHTFWMHAVLTEVYTLHTAILLALLYALYRWHTQNNDRWLLAACFFLGFGFSNHGLILFTLPGCGLFVISCWAKKRIFPGARLLFLMLLSAVAGASLILALALQDCLRAGSLKNCMAVFSGLLGAGSLADMHLSASKAGLMLAYLFYQFPCAGFLLGISGIYTALSRSTNTYTLMLAILFFTYFMFPVSYSVRDSYQFAISAYVCFALFVSLGVQNLQALLFRRFSCLRMFPWACIALLTALPCITYYGAPAVCDRFGIDLLNARTLPYRDNNRYFLLPPKNGDLGAHRYGTAALAAVEPNAVIVGDYTPIMVIQYFQEVKGTRRDIDTRIGLAEAQLREIRENIGRRPVYVAALETNPALAAGNMYLSMRHLNEFTVMAAPPVFRILQKN